MEVNIHEAKTQLSKLIQQVLDGEEVIIAKAGTPLVRLVRIAEDPPMLGSAEGLFTLKDGWDQPLRYSAIEVATRYTRLPLCNQQPGFAFCLSLKPLGQPPIPTLAQRSLVVGDRRQNPDRQARSPHRSRLLPAPPPQTKVRSAPGRSNPQLRTPPPAPTS